MMTTPSPFDHRPDPELGAALRDALTASDDEAFTARVLAAAEGVYGQGLPVQEWWDVVTAWARPGMAAALTLVAAATFWIATASSAEQEVTLEDVFLAGGGEAVPVMLVAEAAPPDLDRLLALGIEGEQP